ncbi:MAG: alpha/beta hydrolase, partial [Gammaproteobacteria bacterium]|nr:alpha/beta hydrolase [Gammaproteobacteria bacterium]
VHRWLVPDARANLLLVHGYFDHTGLFGKLIEWALAAGCNVLMFDLPGHGLSSGEPAAIDDFAQYSLAIHDVLSCAGTPGSGMPDLSWWAMGQSTGCAAITDYARHYDWPFDAAVLLAPLVRPVAWGLVRIGHALAGRWRRSVPRRFTANSTDSAFLEFIRNDPLQARHTSMRWVGALRRWLAELELTDLGLGPVFMVQGDNDGTVDWRYNLKAIVQLYPGTQVLMLPGAGHQLANETAAYRRQYLTAVRAYLADCGIHLDAN